MYFKGKKISIENQIIHLNCELGLLLELYLSVRLKINWPTFLCGMYNASAMFLCNWTLHCVDSNNNNNQARIEARLAYPGGQGQRPGGGKLIVKVCSFEKRAFDSKGLSIWRDHKNKEWVGNFLSTPPFVRLRQRSDWHLLSNGEDVDADEWWKLRTCNSRRTLKWCRGRWCCHRRSPRLRCWTCPPWNSFLNPYNHQREFDRKGQCSCPQS